MSVTLRTVSEDEADIRLDRWFRRHYPALTQGRIQKLCRTGQVRVDGRRAGAATRLAPGQAVRVPPMPDKAPSPAATVPDRDTQREAERMVLFRDEALMVLNKPNGLPVQGGPGIARHLDAMLDALRFGQSERPRLVHRLDRDTSGLLLLARTPGVAAKLAAAFRDREVRKTYWAVVAGRPAPGQGRIDLPLIRTGRQTDRAAVASHSDAAGSARAITDYRVRDHAGESFAWLELEPLTGRTHQLRVHCAALGTPILGDSKYAAGAAAGLIDPSAVPLHLHARRLVLPHPAGGMLEAEAELPPHMRETFRALGFEAPAARAPRRLMGRTS
jgi:23S rRNA pseudouridine955/2504/2580 synthase